MIAAIASWAQAHATGPDIGAGAIALVLLLLLIRAGVRILRRFDPADIITVAIALAATIWAGTGTWQFLGKAMGYHADLKSILVSVFEGAVIVSGMRARRNIEKTGRPGKDGVGLWVLTGISSILAASESASPQEVLGRLLVPIVGAWLWERLLEAKADEARAKARAESGAELEAAARIRWRVSPARILVWLRLAEATSASLSAIESNRKVVAYLNASDREQRGRSLRLPFSAKSRAERARRRLASHALLHHGDPAAVHAVLADRMLAEALNRLGFAPTTAKTANPAVASPVANTGPVDNPDGPTTTTANPVLSPALSPTRAANDNPPAVASRQSAKPPVASAGDTSGDKTEALVVATLPAYERILSKTGKRPTAPALVSEVPGLNTPSRAKQIREVVEDRWYPEMKPRFRVVEQDEPIEQAS